MLCDVCQRPAAVECSGCGKYFCPDHGGERCFRCSGAFMAVDPAAPPLLVPRLLHGNKEGRNETPPDTAIYTTERTSRYDGKGYLQSYTSSEMVSIYVDDPEPPSCHLCGKLARHLCPNCQQLVCPDHRRTNDLCPTCARSSWMGVWIAAAAILFLILFVFLLR